MTRLRLRQTLALMQAIVQHLHQGYASHGFTLPPQCTVASYSWVGLIACLKDFCLPQNILRWLGPCDPGPSQLSNSAGQIACDVVNAVVSPGCLTVTRGLFGVLHLSALRCFVAHLFPGSRDPLPSSSCACNTVLYSLMYACGLCADSPKLLVTYYILRVTVR